jgi:hypothetical protein
MFVELSMFGIIDAWGSIIPACFNIYTIRLEMLGVSTRGSFSHLQSGT